MKGYNVYINDQYRDFIPSRNKKALKDWVKSNVICTHMGQWTKSDTGYEYATTIGRYYKFERAERPNDI